VRDTVNPDVQAYVVERVRTATLETRPGPYLVVEQLLPPAVYGVLLGAIPPPEGFDPDDPVKANFDPLQSTGAPAQAAVWRAFARGVVAGVLTPALVARFESVLGVRLEELFGSHAPAARRLALEAFRSRLMLRRPGYALKPHRDSKIVLITGLLYLARPGDDPAYGTDLYAVAGDHEAPSMKTFYAHRAGTTATLARRVPFVPNTALFFLNQPGLAHGATFPSDAPQADRYTYQFYVGPREAELAALVQQMPAAARALWTGLPGSDVERV
jgi:hypothetical protein